MDQHDDQQSIDYINGQPVTLPPDATFFDRIAECEYDADDTILDRLTTRQKFRVASEILSRLFEFITRQSRGDAEQIGRRAKLCAFWLWPDSVGAKTMEELALQDGVSKQTYCALANKFLKAFPGFIAPGMRRLSARLNMSKSWQERHAA